MFDRLRFRTRAESGPAWSILGHCWSHVADFGPCLVKLSGPHRSKMGQTWPKVGQTWATSCQSGPSSSLAQHRSSAAQSWSIPERWPKSVRIRSKSGLAGGGVAAAEWRRLCTRRPAFADMRVGGSNLAVGRSTLREGAAGPSCALVGPRLRVPLPLGAPPSSRRVVDFSGSFHLSWHYKARPTRIRSRGPVALITQLGALCVSTRVVALCMARVLCSPRVRRHFGSTLASPRRLRGPLPPAAGLASSAFVLDPLLGLAALAGARPYARTPGRPRTVAGLPRRRSCGAAGFLRGLRPDGCLCKPGRGRPLRPLVWSSRSRIFSSRPPIAPSPPRAGSSYGRVSLTRGSWGPMGPIRVSPLSVVVP